MGFVEKARQAPARGHGCRSEGLAGRSVHGPRVWGDVLLFGSFGFSQWTRPKIPHQSMERVLEPFHLEDAVVFRFPGCAKPAHAKVIRVRKDRDTGERMYDVSSSEFQNMNLNVTWSRRWRPRVSPGPRRGGFATVSIPHRSSPKTKNSA